MALYNRESKLSEAILNHPQLIPVINRLGVRLGVGEHTIGSICSREHIDADFFLSVINTFLDPDYFPVNARDTFTREKTVDYLRKTSFYYVKVQIPNIRRHFGSLIARSGEDNNLAQLHRFFEETALQIENIVAKDEVTVFPALLSGDLDNVTEVSAESHSEVEEKLHDLLYLFVAHLRGDYDRNLATAVVTAIFSLEKDYRQNNRIRRRILLPQVRRGKETIDDYGG
ncbi:MAG: helix-turn-helix transcriptional regulator [Muribaculaceae bacterium]|nr:helix-turn-helix transcriptional regulator [Muribaculaceae bacterium]